MLTKLNTHYRSHSNGHFVWRTLIHGKIYSAVYEIHHNYGLPSPQYWVTNNEWPHFASRIFITYFVLSKKKIYIPQDAAWKAVQFTQDSFFYISTFCFQNRQNSKRPKFDAAKMRLFWYTTNAFLYNREIISPFVKFHYCQHVKLNLFENRSMFKRKNMNSM